MIRWTSLHHPTRALTIAALTSALGVLSCGSTEGDICSAKCDCEGCSDRAYSDCSNSFDDTQARADRVGCLDFYDRYVQCLDDTGRCRAGDYETDCGPEAHALESCLGSDISPGCLTNNDCGGDHPICAPGGECVECLVTADCAVGLSCIKNKCE